MFIIISTIKSAHINLSPYSFKFKISWENWGFSVHDWAWAAPLAWLTTMSLFTWTWGSAETSKRQTHTTFYDYLHPRHDSLLSTAFPSDRLPLYHKIRPLLRPTHSCLPFGSIPILPHFRIHLKVKPDSLLSQSEHQCWSWTRTRGLSSEFQTCKSSCPCATSTLGHLRITMSKIQLPILPLNPVPTTTFPISILYMFGQKIWGGYLLPIMATSDVAGKSISSVFKLHEESAPMYDHSTPTSLVQPKPKLFEPSSLVSFSPPLSYLFPLRQFSLSNIWNSFKLSVHPLFQTPRLPGAPDWRPSCSGCHHRRVSLYSAPCKHELDPRFPERLLLKRTSKALDMLVPQPVTLFLMVPFRNGVPHPRTPTALETAWNGSDVGRRPWLGGFRIWVCFRPSEGPENTTLTQAGCSNIAMLEEPVGVALPGGRAI